jgi:predicted aminopeptidase
MRRWLLGAVLVLALAGVAGCSTLGYYLQAVNGQMELTRKARPIPQVLGDEHTPEDLKARLARVQEIRTFASQELALPDNGSYRRYADLQRPYVVWNVFAAEEFSVVAKEWCFPVAGCVGYRGYFAQDAADAFAAQLRQQGVDVYVGGVPAYSTLGWMDDPVLSTFIRYPDTEIARLIFHELAHQVVYLPGDSTFNESFATAVELEGVKRWLAAQGTPEQFADFQAAQARKRDFAGLVTRYRDKLALLYASGKDAPAMRSAKADTLAQMRADYQALREQWGGFAGYDWWFDQPLNNAQIASVAMYTQLVPGFQKLLAESGGDLPRFYAAVKALAKAPEKERLAVLEPGSRN